MTLGTSAATDVPVIWHDSQDADRKGVAMRDINTYGGYVARLANDAC